MVILKYNILLCLHIKHRNKDINYNILYSYSTVFNIIFISNIYNLFVINVSYLKGHCLVFMLTKE